MEPQFQTSFIPKKPIISTKNDPVSTEHSINLFSLFSTIVFIVAILVCGGLFFYKQFTVSQIEKANQEIIAAREAFQPETIKELTDVSARISVTNKLLNFHTATYRLFDVLQSLTVKKVKFNSFVYKNSDNLVTVSMDTEGQNYNALAEQLNAFMTAGFISNAKFTDFDLAENGNILTKFSANVDPTALTYRKAIESLNIDQ